MLSAIIVNFLGQVEFVEHQVTELVKVAGIAGTMALLLALLAILAVRGYISIQLARLQLQIALQNAEVNKEHDESEITKQFLQLLSKSSDHQERTANILDAIENRVDVIAGIESAARQHYTSTENHQKLIEPLLTEIKTTVINTKVTVDQTDLRVGELHTSKRDLVNQVIEVNKAVQMLNQTLTEYLNRDTSPEPLKSIPEMLEDIRATHEPTAAEIKEFTQSVTELKTDVAPQPGETTTPAPESSEVAK